MTIEMSPALHAALRSLQKSDIKKQATAVMSETDTKAEHVRKAQVHVESYIAWREAAKVVSRVLNSEIER